MYTAVMEWLNYHHLLYFWMVAKKGSIARAKTALSPAHYDPDSLTVRRFSCR